MISKKLGLILCMVLMISCNNNEQCGTSEARPKEWYISDILTSKDIDVSIRAYDEFCFYYPNDIDFIPLTIHMINQKHYSRACNYMYGKITNICEKYSISLDSMSQEYVLYYLKKGIEMKDIDCATNMAFLYMKGELVDKDTVMAKNYIMNFYPPEEAKRTWEHIKRKTIKK